MCQRSTWPRRSGENCTGQGLTKVSNHIQLLTYWTRFITGFFPKTWNYTLANILKGSRGRTVMDGPFPTSGWMNAVSSGRSPYLEIAMLPSDQGNLDDMEDYGMKLEPGDPVDLADFYRMKDEKEWAALPGLPGTILLSMESREDLW